MPNVLAETIHYNPVGAKDALDKIRQFALSLGWTVDYWSTTDGSGSDYYLQIWSKGYALQNICYRFYVTNVDANEDTMSVRAVVPGYRYNQTSKITNNTTTWGGQSTSYYNISLPATSFDALYLYGNLHFIAAIFHVDPIAVITVPIGTYELFPSWWYTVDGLFFWYGSQYWGTTSAYKWYNMADNPTNWYIPYAQRSSSTVGYNLWWEGAKRDSGNYASNYQPTSVIAVGSEAGNFNLMKGFLNWNSFTSKRAAFSPTMFAKDPDLGVWYPIGSPSMCYVNGRNLTIGEQITFGSDIYRCFPGVFTLYEIWQAYRTA